LHELSLAIVAPLAAMLVEMAGSRSRADLADEGGGLAASSPLIH